MTCPRVMACRRCTRRRPRRPAYARGLCKSCYNREQEAGRLDDWPDRYSHAPEWVICEADGCLCLPDEVCPACRVARQRRPVGQRVDLLATGTNVYDALRAARRELAEAS
jgi:hypothetical protein